MAIIIVDVYFDLSGGCTVWRFQLPEHVAATVAIPKSQLTGSSEVVCDKIHSQAIGA